MLMQCERCGASFDPTKHTCRECGAALQQGSTVCPSCGQALHCEWCDGPIVVREGEPDTVPSAPSSGELRYEYQTIQVRVPPRNSEETTPVYAQRVQHILVNATAPAALEGWETVDPLDIGILDRDGYVQRGMWTMLLRGPLVSIRLKRLVG